MNIKTIVNRRRNALFFELEKNGKLCYVMKNTSTGLFEYCRIGDFYANLIKYPMYQSELSKENIDILEYMFDNSKVQIEKLSPQKSILAYEQAEKSYKSKQVQDVYVDNGVPKLLIETYEEGGFGGGFTTASFTINLDKHMFIIIGSKEESESDINSIDFNVNEVRWDSYDMHLMITEFLCFKLNLIAD